MERNVSEAIHPNEIADYLSSYRHDDDVVGLTGRGNADNSVVSKALKDSRGIRFCVISEEVRLIRRSQLPQVIIQAPDWLRRFCDYVDYVAYPRLSVSRAQALAALEHALEDDNTHTDDPNTDTDAPLQLTLAA